MTKSTRKWLIVVLGIAVLFALTLHATHKKPDPRMANYSFGWGSVGVPENPGIEVLDYKYGNTGMPGTHPPEGQFKTGHIAQADGGLFGWMPVDVSLYVKWRVLSTGKVYEDTVDLRSRLPADMNKKIVHFLIKNSQLYVYLIEGETSAYLHVKNMPACPVPAYADVKCTRIYPDRWSNF